MIMNFHPETPCGCRRPDLPPQWTPGQSSQLKTCPSSPRNPVSPFSGPFNETLKRSTRKANSQQKQSVIKSISSLLLTLIAPLVFLNSCSNVTSPESPVFSAAYTSYHPETRPGVTLRHYPVGRQGNLTAWLTSDHRMSAGNYLYNPTDANTRHRIVGRIRASAMKVSVKHDGAFLLTGDYTGPIYPLWEGTESKALLYAGETKGWIPVDLEQRPAVNTWVITRRSDPIGGWSGYPVVIGDPANPESVAGAMWYRSNLNRRLGGAASTRMLKEWLDRLDFKKFVK